MAGAVMIFSSPKTNEGRRFLDDLLFDREAAAALPATTADTNTYAARANADPDARTTVISAIVVSASSDVTFARRVVVRILNHNPSLAAFPPAASILVTNHADVFDAVVGSNREVACKRRSRGSRREQCARADRK
jgi:hypothetical protein